MVNAVPDVDAWLYRLVQFAIREAVASRTVDEVLSAKNALDAELRAFVRGRIAETGIEVTELGVKDVILPGEIRELVNKVVEAERTAKANLIRRQEETAATHSLLNTAKPMEENPLLLRLKEFESLERLVGEGRPHRPARRRRRRPRRAPHPARAPEGGRAELSGRLCKMRVARRLAALSGLCLGAMGLRKLRRNFEGGITCFLWKSGEKLKRTQMEKGRTSIGWSCK